MTSCWSESVVGETGLFFCLCAASVDAVQIDANRLDLHPAGGILALLRCTDRANCYRCRVCGVRRRTQKSSDLWAAPAGKLKRSDPGRGLIACEKTALAWREAGSSTPAFFNFMAVARLLRDGAVCANMQ
jgi:hypothetical protein